MGRPHMLRANGDGEALVVIELLWDNDVCVGMRVIRTL
jgi:hypothetical protein